MFSIFHKKKDLPSTYVFFDIDGCIANGFQENFMDVVCHKYPWTKPFHEYGLCIKAIYPHIILPGVIEFIQALDNMPFINIAFFSSSTKDRNIIFCEQLLRLALGDERYDIIKDNIKIGSECDLKKTEEIKNYKKKARYAYDYFGISRGIKKKNLQDIVPDCDLNWSVLIDDQNTFAFFGQEKNILMVPSAESTHFNLIYTKHWKATEAFPHVNQIFYAAGVFFSALKKAQKEKISLVEALFCIQFKKINHDPDCKKSRIKSQLHTEDFTYYDIGLEKLRKINPELNFSTPENFLSRANVVLNKERPKTLAL